MGISDVFAKVPKGCGDGGAVYTLPLTSLFHCADRCVQWDALLPEFSNVGNNTMEGAGVGLDRDDVTYVFHLYIFFG